MARRRRVPVLQGQRADQPAADDVRVVRDTQGSEVLHPIRRHEPRPCAQGRRGRGKLRRGFGKLLEGVASSVGGSTVPGLRAGTDTLADADAVFSLKPKSRLMQYLVTNRRREPPRLAWGSRSAVPRRRGRRVLRPGRNHRPLRRRVVVGRVPGVAAWGSPRSSGRRSPTPVIPSSGKIAAEQVGPEVDAKVAEQVVRRWQHAKAQALGVAHNLKPLEQVLEGPMLQQWLTRAEDVRSHGWAWEYQLNSLSIDKVESLSETRARWRRR